VELTTKSCTAFVTDGRSRGSIRAAAHWNGVLAGPAPPPRRGLVARFRIAIWKSEMPGEDPSSMAVGSEWRVGEMRVIPDG